MIWPRVCAPAATYWTPGSSLRAAASSGVIVVELPWPILTPPVEKLPAFTMIMLVPADFTRSSMVVRAPVPRPTIVMTAPTPMIIPSIVRTVRILLRFSALSAIRRVMKIDMCFLAHRGLRLNERRRHVRGVVVGRRQVLELLDRHPPVRDLLIELDLAVPELDQPRAVFGDIHFVRDEHHGDAVFHVQLLEDVHDLDARPCIEVSSRLVREDDRRLVDQRPRDGDALLLPAGELIRVVIHPLAEADDLEHFLRAAVPFGRFHLVAPAVIEQRQLDVVERRRARQEVEALEDEADLAVPDHRELVLRHPRHVLA